jgi:4-hydroxy-tetrahydrodipicolinate reductase
MAQIKIIVSGAGGKMGQRVVQNILAQPDLTLVGALESSEYPDLGKEILPGVKFSRNLEEIIDKGEVLIEFTTPQATMEHLQIAASHHKRMVIGTTGFSEEEYGEIKALSSSIPLLLSPNMSVGVNLLFKLIQEAVRIIGKDYDIEIIETHHRHKKDAPSGTAKKILKLIATGLSEEPEKIAVYGREGHLPERGKGVVGIHALRGGGVIGEHRVVFLGENEKLELSHEALSRDIFAEGALRAARFLMTVPAGLYSMEDVLKLSPR